MAIKVPTQTSHPTSILPRKAARGTAVITDSGDTAAVIVVKTDRSLGIGSRFQHDGVTWRINSRRPHSRALIATPVDA
jgi:hypothetical protein